LTPDTDAGGGKDRGGVCFTSIGGGAESTSVRPFIPKLWRFLCRSCDQLSSAVHGEVFRSGFGILEGDRACPGPWPQKVHLDVFPDGRVTTRGAVQATKALGVKTPQRVHTLFQGDEQGAPVKRSRQDQESRRTPIGIKHSPRGWTVKEVS